MFFKVGVLENFALFAGKHLSYLKVFKSYQNLLKRESNTGVCEHFQNSFFYRTPPVAASVSMRILELYFSRQFLKKALLILQELKILFCLVMLSFDIFIA